MHGCIDAWMHGCVGERMHMCIDARMHGCMDAWMDTGHTPSRNYCLASNGCWRSRHRLKVLKVLFLAPFSQESKKVAHAKMENTDKIIYY